jgi:hypothetical protein
VDQILEGYAKEGLIDLGKSTRGHDDDDEDGKGGRPRRELDEGVISLLKRHSCATVEKALGEYVEEKQRDGTRGKTMDNPSAYLTHIVGRIAAEDAEADSNKRNNSSKREDRPSKMPKKETTSDGL